MRLSALEPRRWSGLENAAGMSAEAHVALRRLTESYQHPIAMGERKAFY